MKGCVFLPGLWLLGHQIEGMKKKSEAVLGRWLELQQDILKHNGRLHLRGD
jgi:hypothetical protein